MSDTYSLPSPSTYPHKFSWTHRSQSNKEKERETVYLLHREEVTGNEIVDHCEEILHRLHTAPTNIHISNRVIKYNTPAQSKHEITYKALSLTANHLGRGWGTDIPERIAIACTSRPPHSPHPAVPAHAGPASHRHGTYKRRGEQRRDTSAMHTHSNPGPPTSQSSERTALSQPARPKQTIQPSPPPRTHTT